MPAPQSKPMVVTFSRVVSLSHSLTPNAPRWPGDPALEAEWVADIETHGYALRRVSLGEHTGTHLTTARCFDPTGTTTDDLDPEQLVGPAVVVPAPAAMAGLPAGIGRGVFEAWEQSHGRIEPGTWVLVRTGWDARWVDPAAYMATDATGALAHPGVSEAAARWLARERGIAGLGIDSPGAEPGSDSGFRTSRTVLAAGGLILENLTRLHQVPERGATLVIGALPLAGGAGSPAQVLALCP
jgi:kynurenine formamidase